MFVKSSAHALNSSGKSTAGTATCFTSSSWTAFSLDGRSVTPCTAPTPKISTVCSLFFYVVNRYRKNPALDTTTSALRLIKQWVMRVISVGELAADADHEHHQQAVERVLLQQRCAVSEWLKKENNNTTVFEEILKKFVAAADAAQKGDDNQVSVLARRQSRAFDIALCVNVVSSSSSTSSSSSSSSCNRGQRSEAARLALVRAVAYLCCRQTTEAVRVAQGECCRIIHFEATHP